LLVSQQIQADIVNLCRSAVVCGAGDRDLKFPWQVREFGMKGRPLADDLAVDARILDFVLGDASQMVGGDVADTVAAGLNSVHLHLG